MFASFSEKLIGAIVLAALVVSLGATFPYFEKVRNANERPRLLQILSVWDTGELAIDGPGARGFRPGPDVSRNPDTGLLYPNKPPGGTLSGLLAYPIAQWRAGDGPPTLRDLTFWARILGGLLPTLLLLGLALRHFSQDGNIIAVCLALTLYAAGTPAHSYAHLFYGHQLAAFALFGGILYLSRAGREQNLPLAILGGLMAGTAVLVEYGAGFAGIPIGLTLLLNGRHRAGRSLLLWAVLGAAIPLAMLLAYHHVAFGSVLSTGYHHVINPEFAMKHGQGFLGLGIPTWDGFFTHVLDPGGGLLWWAPLTPLALYGLFQESRNGYFREEARLFLSFFILLILVGAGLSFDGGWRIGPRYLVVALPGLILGWKRCFEGEHSLGYWTIISALAFGSLAINGVAANVWPHLDLSAIETPWSDVLRPLLQEGAVPYLVWEDTALFFPAILLLPTMVFALLLFLHPNRRSAGIGAIFGCILSASFLILMPPSDAPNQEGNLRYIRSVYEPKLETRIPLPSAPILPLLDRKSGTPTPKSPKPKAAQRKGSRP